MRFDQSVTSLDVLSATEARDLQLVVRSSHNVLVEGPQALVQALLHSVVPTLRQPVNHWRRGPLPLGCATLLVRDASMMSPEDQQSLLNWNKQTHARCRLITVSSVPLYSCVKRGEFHPDLYYRLNTLFIRFDALD
jgi:hypothetical protein